MKKIKRALAAHQAGNLNQAEILYKEVLAKDPGNVDANNLYGLLAHQVGRSDIAVALIGKALDVKPDFIPALNNMGIAHQTLGHIQEAISCYRRVLALNPKHITSLDNMGAACHALGQTETALTYFLKSNTLSPKRPALLNTISWIYKDLGRKKEAVTFIRQALKIAPGYGQAWENLSGLIKFKDHNRDIRQMEALYEDNSLPSQDKMFLGFALGKAFEDLKNYPKSFSYTQNANALKRSSLTYDVNQDIKTMEAVATMFTKEFMARHTKGMTIIDDSPIFILGMPRSGTTLVEQILASHSTVEGGGELSDLIDILRGYSNQAGVKFPMYFADLDSATLQGFAQAYLGQIKNRFPHAERITDKLPQNFLFIGLLKIILPHAKIIHCNREPMASCYSIFKTHFGRQAGAKEGMRYAYDLEELGQYCRHYLKLMAHWNALYPEFIYDIKYEALVSDPEAETRKLLNFCNLSWEEQCLEFYNTKRQVSTASNLQVRQPIYEGSVHLWQNYEPHLVQLRQALYTDE